MHYCGGGILYRSTLPEFSETDGELIQLNSTLIPSQAPGSGQGNMYEWLDTDVQAGTTYYYWLDALRVDVNGESSLHGPVSATMSVPTAITVQQLTQQSHDWALGPLILILLGLIMLARIGWEWRRIDESTNRRIDESTTHDHTKAQRALFIRLRWRSVLHSLRLAINYFL